MLFGDADQDEIYLEGISFVLVGNPFANSRGYTVWPARLTEDTTSVDLDNLAGKLLKGKTILAVERFATLHQPAGRAIGIIVED